MLHEYCQNRPKDHDANSAQSAKNPAKGLNHSLCSVYIFGQGIQFFSMILTCSSKVLSRRLQFSDGALSLQRNLQEEIVIAGGWRV